MKHYTSKFNNHTDYEAAKDNLLKPNVSVCITENHTHYMPFIPHDYAQDYLTFTALENGTFKLSGNSVNYSMDNGETWTSLGSNASSPTINAGEKIMWKATLTPSASSPQGIGRFISTGRYTAEGNPMSMLFGDNFSGQDSLAGKNCALFSLFSGSTGLTSAENLALPATTLAVSAYTYMFRGCTSLTTAPVLPATTLANYCYSYMFYDCTSLTVAPVLSATTLANNCYYEMFKYCRSLTVAPELPATTLANKCYYYMFDGCTSLTTAPELPATTLAEWCYGYMFEGCRSLTTAPSVLPATTLYPCCYGYMFDGCTSLTTAPELPATTLATGCYTNMFEGCTNLNSITMLATNISAPSCLVNWVRRVSGSGTFTKNASMTTLPRGDSGIPSGWTVVDA